MIERSQVTDFDTVKQLEQVEQLAWSDFHRAAPPDLAVRYGIAARMTDSACCAMAARIDVLALNRVIGLVKARGVTITEIESWIDIYGSAGAGRFFVQPSPTAVQDGVGSSLQLRGFRHYNNWVKLYRRLEPMTPVKSDLEVREIGPEDGMAFGKIVTECFEWPEAASQWIAATVGRANWHHFMAFDGDLAVATGALYISGEHGWIDFAATLDGYRGRGAQSVLLARRFEMALIEDCRWLIVETAEDRQDKPAPSYRNMIRHGFKPAYLRPNYLWTAGA